MNASFRQSARNVYLNDDLFEFYVHKYFFKVGGLSPYQYERRVKDLLYVFNAIRVRS